MKWYIDNELINVLVEPNYNETLDETLDSGTFVLKVSDKKDCFKPMSVLRVEFDDETSSTFLIMSDQVEIASRNPTYYRHTLTFLQNTRKLSKVQVRNTVFSQPAEPKLKGYSTYRYPQSANEGLSRRFYKNITIGAKDKIKKATIKLDAKYIEEKQEGGVSLNAYKLVDAGDVSITASLYWDGIEMETYTLTYGQEVDVSTIITQGTYEIFITAVNNSSASGSQHPLKLLALNIMLEVERYYYTLFDILSILRSQLTLNDYDWNQHTSPFNMPTDADLLSILNATIAPNFTFTQSNLYDCIAQIFLFLDGVPTLDENDVLGIEYFNELNTSFTYNNNNTIDEQSSISEDRYINGLITDYQRGKAAHDIVYPSTNTFNSTKSKDLGVVDFPDTAIFPVSFPIRAIRKVEVVIDGTITFDYINDPDETAITDSYSLDINEVLDLTEYFVGQDYYDSLTETTGYLNLLNTIPYQQGATNIDVSLKTPYSSLVEHYNLKTAISNELKRKYTVYDLENRAVMGVYKYRITYEPMVDGRLKITGTKDKYEGEIRLDQTSGNVDLTRLGTNVFGSSIKLGNEEITKSYKFINWNNRIKKGTIWTDEDNNKFIAETINTTFFKDFISQKIKFTKNFNKLSNYINLNENKRFNNIDGSLITKSEDDYSEYLYFSNSPINERGEPIHIQNGNILFGIKGSLVWSSSWYSAIEMACIDKGEDYVYIPLFKYGAGNSLNFEMQYDNPISAGYQFDVSNVIFATKYESSVVNYTDDDYGFKDKFTIKFTDLDIDAATFPIVENSVMESATIYGGFDELEYYKKPNEIFALNYSLVLLPYKGEEFFFGENFIKNNGILGYHNQNKCDLYVSTTEKYSVLDRKAIGTKLGEVSTINESSNLSNYSYVIGGYTCPYDIVSWCLADKEGNILLSTNQELSNGDNFAFYVITKHIISKYYTIQWVNYNGTVLETDRLLYGEMPSYDGATPTQPSNQFFDFTFLEWRPTPTIVTSNATYTAWYEATRTHWNIGYKCLKVWQEQIEGYFGDITNDVVIPVGDTYLDGAEMLNLDFTGWVGYSITNDVDWNSSNRQIIANEVVSDTYSIARAYFVPQSFNITMSGTNGTSSGSTLAFYGNHQVSRTIVANTNFGLPTDISVNGMFGIHGTYGCTWSYNDRTGVVNISYATGDVEISFVCRRIGYTVTFVSNQATTFSQSTFNNIISIDSENNGVITMTRYDGSTRSCLYTTTSGYTITGVTYNGVVKTLPVILDSDTSVTTTYISIPQLATPTGVTISATGTLSWNAVPNAVSYRVFKGQTLIESGITTTSVNLRNYGTLAGDCDVYFVQAIGDGTNYGDSEKAGQYWTANYSVTFSDNASITYNAQPANTTNVIEIDYVQDGVLVLTSSSGSESNVYYRVSIGYTITGVTYNGVVGTTPYTPSANTTITTTYSIASYYYSVSVSHGNVYPLADASGYLTYGSSKVIYIVPYGDYELPSTISVNGYTGNAGSQAISNCDWSYNSSTGALTISNLNDDITISVSCSTIPTHVYQDYQVYDTDGNYYSSASGSVYCLIGSTYGDNAPTPPAGYYLVGVYSSTQWTNDITNLAIPRSGGYSRVYALYAPTAYSLSVSGTNGTYSAPSTIYYGQGATITITPNSGYQYPSANQISVSGATIDTYSTGTLILSNCTGNTSVSFTCSPAQYSITTTVTNGSYSGASFITYGSTATITLSANTNYKLPSSISVNNASYYYNSETGRLVISSPTGNVSISVVCEEIYAYN